MRGTTNNINVERRTKILIILGIAALIVAFQPRIARAEWTVHHTQFVSILYENEGDLETLFKRVDGSSLSRLFGGGKYSEEKLEKVVDELLRRVGELLGMRTKGVSVKIKLYKDKRTMGAEVFPFLKGNIAPAFYFAAQDTIYVSLDDLDANILAHEFTHALLYHHFDKPVPMVTQEILCQYIDLNI